jgi:hypothetical protein
LWDVRSFSSPGWDRGDVSGDLWDRIASGAIEIVIARFDDDVMVMRLHVTRSWRRPPVGTVEFGSRGASVLSGQAVSGAAELICAVG